MLTVTSPPSRCRCGSPPGSQDGSELPLRHPPSRQEKEERKEHAAGGGGCGAEGEGGKRERDNTPVSQVDHMSSSLFTNLHLHLLSQIITVPQSVYKMKLYL